jgi:8-oxo-dGTP diphosphatase
VCLRQGNQVLLIQRGKEPGLGKWAFPGGKVQWGETTAEAALRELQEESGLSGTIGPMLGLYDVVQPTYHFAIACYFASGPVGELKAGTDAADARWFHVDEVAKLNLASNIAQVITISKTYV